MRPDGASMLTMLYEGEPGWSGPSRSAPTTRAERSRPGASRAAPSGSVARGWPADDEQLLGSKGQQR
jgi:hypothetical protein